MTPRGVPADKRIPVRHPPVVVGAAPAARVGHRAAVLDGAHALRCRRVESGVTETAPPLVVGAAPPADFRCLGALVYRARDHGPWRSFPSRGATCGVVVAAAEV